LPDNPDITVNQAYLQQLAANGQTDYMPPEMPDKIYKVSDLLGMVYNNNLSEVQINQMFQSIMNKMQSLGLKQDELLEKSEDIIEINPGFMGVSVNLREAWRQWVK